MVGGMVHWLTIIVIFLIGGVFFLAGLNMYNQRLIEDAMMCFLLVFLCVGMEVIVISLLFPQDD